MGFGILTHGHMLFWTNAAWRTNDEPEIRKCSFGPLQGRQGVPVFNPNIAPGEIRQTGMYAPSKNGRPPKVHSFWRRPKNLVEGSVFANRKMPSPAAIPTPYRAPPLSATALPRGEDVSAGQIQRSLRGRVQPQSCSNHTQNRIKSRPSEKNSFA